MLLYNETIILEDTAEKEWLQFMEEQHLPDMMETDLVVSNRTLRVIDSPNEGATYCVQYIFENMIKYEQFLEKNASAIHNRLNEKFKNRFVAYRTLMEFLPQNNAI